MSWKRRLGIAISIVWILLWFILYLMDPHKDLRASAFGVMGFGVFPVLIGWLGWWVWDGYSRRK